MLLPVVPSIHLNRYNPVLKMKGYIIRVPVKEIEESKLKLNHINWVRPLSTSVPLVFSHKVW